MSSAKLSSLSAIVEQVAASTLDQFASIGLKDYELAMTVVKFESTKSAGSPAFVRADYRGNELVYPASIVKLFFLVAAHAWLEGKKIDDTPELRRAIKDMIVESSNDATHYVIDVLTGTTSGPELPEAEMYEWMKRRNVINEFFARQGYDRLNLNQKPWGDGPYGRERIFVGADYHNRNMLTTNLTARLLCEIVQGKAVNETRSKQMLELMQRGEALKKDDPDDQASQFCARGLPPDCRLWSKAGWTSTVRHDAAYVEKPDGTKFIIVVFTTNHAKKYEIIPYVAGKVSRAV